MMASDQEQVALRLVVALLIARSAYAQNTNTAQGGGTTTGNNQQTNTQPQQTTTGNNQQTTTGNNQNTQNTANTKPTGGNTQNTAAAAASTNGGTPTGTPSQFSLSAVPTGNSNSKSSGGSSPSTVGGLPELPTIAGYGIPTQVVPWTGGAAFMQKSNYPSGTIFICVGAILGFMGVAVLAWRLYVSWDLQRSVKQANEKMNAQETVKLTKTGYGSASHYAASSNLSLDRISSPPVKKPVSRSPLAPLQNALPGARNSSLFFSPTSGAGHHSSPSASALLQNGNRLSGFLPAGYYAAPGVASPVAGSSGTLQLGGGAPRGSYIRHNNYGPSPPGSPNLPPSRGQDRAGQGLYSQHSNSTLNLNIPGGAHPGHRAPSANLEDLFDGGLPPRLG